MARQYNLLLSYSRHLSLRPYEALERVRKRMWDNVGYHSYARSQGQPAGRLAYLASGTARSSVRLQTAVMRECRFCEGGLVWASGEQAEPLRKEPALPDAKYIS